MTEQVSMDSLRKLQYGKLGVGKCLILADFIGNSFTHRAALPGLLENVKLTLYLFSHDETHAENLCSNNEKIACLMFIYTKLITLCCLKLNFDV